MRKHGTLRPFVLVAFALGALIATRIVLAAAGAPPEADEFRGRVASPSGSGSAGDRQGEGGRPIANATVHLVPVTAVDVTSPITASGIYQAPFPAEAYDEPLEDAIRLHGDRFPQTRTDAQGRFAIGQVPEGQFFVHVTPDAKDAEHLPGGDVSRQSYSASQLRGHSMNITLSSKPSPQARSVGSSACLSCHQDQRHWSQTAHKIGWTVPQAPGKMQDFSRHPQYFDALRAFVETDDYRTGTRLEIGDYDARRGTDKFVMRGAGDTRLPLGTPYADLFLWKKKQDGKYYMTLVNRLNPNDPNSPADLEIKLLYGGAVHDQRYVVSVPPSLGRRPAWYTTVRYNMTGRDNRLNRQRRVWQDYKLDLWWSGGADARVGTGDDIITAPPVNTNALQTMCAGCHLTGWERYEDKATGQLLVRAVNDPSGDVNIDDDPEMDEVNIGCERCHGPGSEHAAEGSLPRDRQPEVPVGGARGRDLRSLPRPASGIRRRHHWIHAAAEQRRRPRAARNQPARAHHRVHRSGQEGADDERAGARGQHLAGRCALESASSAVFRFPQVEDVPEPSDAGHLFRLPRHARGHSVSAISDARRGEPGVAALPAMPSGGSAVSYGDQAQRPNEGHDDALHRLPHARHGHRRRHRRGLRQVRSNRHRMRTRRKKSPTRTGKARSTPMYSTCQKRRTWSPGLPPDRRCRFPIPPPVGLATR